MTTKSDNRSQKGKPIPTAKEYTNREKQRLAKIFEAEFGREWVEISFCIILGWTIPRLRATGQPSLINLHQRAQSALPLKLRPPKTSTFAVNQAIGQGFAYPVQRRSNPFGPKCAATPKGLKLLEKHAAVRKKILEKKRKSHEQRHAAWVAAGRPGAENEPQGLNSTNPTGLLTPG